MTTINEAREAIYARFIANFTGTSNITFDNEDFDDPASGSWVRLSIRHAVRLQDTLGRSGNRSFKSGASVFIQVYTAINAGLSLADTLAREAANVFEGVSFSELDFRGALIKESGPTGKWYQTLVEIEFDYYETK